MYWILIFIEMVLQATVTSNWSDYFYPPMHEN